MPYRKVSFASDIAEPDIVAMQQEATNKRKMIEALKRQSGQRPTINAWGVAADIADALAERKLASDADEAQAGAAEKQKAMIDQAFGFADQQPQALDIPDSGEYGANIGNAKAIAAALKQGSPQQQSKPAEPNWRLLAQLDPQYYTKMLIDKQNETFSNAVPTGEGRFMQTGNRGNVKFVDGASVPKEYQHVNQGNRIGAFDPSTGRITDLSNGGIAVSPNVSATLPIQQMNAQTSRMNADLDREKFNKEAKGEGILPENYNQNEFDAVVNKVINAEIELPKNPRTPEWQMIMKAAATKDPTFNQADYATRLATKKSATSGKISDTINALNTVAGHLGELDQAIEGLNNFNYPAVNKKWNEMASAFGGTSAKQYETTLLPVAQELTRVYRGAGGSEKDIQEFMKNMSVNDGYDQQKTALRTMAKLVESKLQATSDQYNQGMKTSKKPFELLSPKAQETFSRIIGNDKQQGKSVKFLGYE